MNRRSILLVGTLAFVLSACGVEEAGDWTPVNPVGDLIPTGAEFPGLNKKLVDNDEPTAPVSSAQLAPDFRSGVAVDCYIPENLGEPDLFSGDVSVYQQQDQICMGTRDDNLGESYCNWVTAKEQRYRAVVDCQKRAIQALDKLGEDAMANVRQSWQEVKQRFVPAVWAMTEKEIVADVGHHSGWVALFMGSQGEPVAATPFCFHKERDQSLRDTRDATIFGLWWLWQSRDARESWVLGSLQRGVNILVNPEVKALKVKVVVHPAKPLEPKKKCYFRLP